MEQENNKILYCVYAYSLCGWCRACRGQLSPCLFFHYPAPLHLHVMMHCSSWYAQAECLQS